MKRAIIGIDGMTCSSCSGTVESVLSKIKGVENSSVSLTTNRANICFDSKSLSLSTICDEIESVGFGAAVLESDDIIDSRYTNDIINVVLMIEGMTCNSCSGTVEELLKNISGVESSIVSLATNHAYVSIKKSKVNLHHIISEIESIGFNSRLLSEEATKTKECNVKKIFLKITSLRNEESSFDLNPSISDDMTRRLQLLPGVLEVIKTLDSMNDLQITFDHHITGPRVFHRTLLELGYESTIVLAGGFMMAEQMLKRQKQETRYLLIELLTSLCFTIPIIIIGMVLPMISPAMMHAMEREVYPGLSLYALLLVVLCIPVQWIIGWKFHTKAFKTLKTKTMGMDFMISTGTTAAFLYSFVCIIRGLASGVSRMEDAEYFETSAVLVTVVLFGKFLETYARGVTASAIHSLSALRSHHARLVQSNIATGGKEEKEQGQGQGDVVIDTSMIHTGDRLRLVEGESIPADGEVEGCIGVDESMMTGESRIVPKQIGDLVYGGTIVVEGTCVMHVSACGDDSALGKIVSTVQEAQSSKPPIQEMADRVARYFVPLVGSISVLTSIVWVVLWLSGSVPMHWYDGDKEDTHKDANSFFLFVFMFSLAVWVSACPCAFGLATPTAVLVATGVAAKHGLFIRKGAALQYAADITSVAFDKTGTLTQGKTRVTDHQLYLTAHVNELWLLRCLYSAEVQSSHPLSKGLCEFAKSRMEMFTKEEGLSLSSLELPGTLEVIAGNGVKMTIKEFDFEDDGNITTYSLEHSQDKDRASAPVSLLSSISSPSSSSAMVILVGSPQLMSTHNVPISSEVERVVSGYRAGGKVAIYMSINGVLRGVFGVSDTIRPEASHTIAVLQGKGIPCYMITGDEPATAVAIGELLGIKRSHIFSKAKPEDKGKIITLLQERGEKVAFIGDGTNDSPALARADVGIVMSSGTSIAIDTGDMVLCKNDLNGVLIAFDISTKTMHRIKLNYFWALIYNMMLIPIAAGVLYPFYEYSLSPMLAGAAMALSSVSIVLSSLQLMLYTPPRGTCDESPIASSMVRPLSGVDHDITNATDAKMCQCPASLTAYVARPASGARLFSHTPSNLTWKYPFALRSKYRQLQQNLSGGKEWEELVETGYEGGIELPPSNGQQKKQNNKYSKIQKDDNNQTKSTNISMFRGTTPTDIFDVESGLDIESFIKQSCGCNCSNCRCGPSCQCGVATM